MRLVAATIGAALCAAAVLAGCENEVTYTGVGGTGGTGGTGGEATSSSGTTSSSGGPLPGLPPPPSGAGPGDGPGLTLAVARFYLGDRDWSGVPSMNAWKQLGHNLDGLVSTNDSVNLCQPAAGGSPSNVYPDGNAGIDNSWGKNILPIMTGIAADFSQEVNQRVLTGEYTFLIDIAGLGSQQSYIDLTVRGYDGADRGAPPLLDGTDVWPVKAESLVNPGDIGSAITMFSGSYLNQHTLVAWPLGEVHIEVFLGALLGTPWTLHHGVISMELSPDHTAATYGIIAGVIDTEELIADLQKVAGALDPSLCDSVTFDSIADQLRQASDIMKDGSQDPSKTCDGISVGIGFEAEMVQIGDIAPPEPPMPDPCEEW